MGLSATLGPTASDLSFHLLMWGGHTRHVAWVVRDHLGSIHAYMLRGTAKMPLMMTVAVGRERKKILLFCLGDKSIHDYVRTWHVFLLGPIAAAYRWASVDAPLDQDSPSRRMHRVRSKLLQALLTFFLYPITTMSNVQQAKNHANQAANNANQAANQAVNNTNQAVNKAANKAEKVSKYVSCCL